MNAKFHRSKIYDIFLQHKMSKGRMDQYFYKNIFGTHGLVTDILLCVFVK